MFGDLGKIMKMARDMKLRMPAMRAELDSHQFTADAGGGVVSATVNGKMQLVGLKISDEAAKSGDAEMLEDLINAAVSSAQSQAAAAATAMMTELTGGMQLPGMDDLLGSV
jgi:nucleoid-associated protein EbfC